MKIKFAISILVLMLWSIFLSAQVKNITIKGTQFYVDCNRIWLNGVNTPWHSWNDLGGGSFDASWWNTHFQTLKSKGVNCSRVWISCNGGGGVYTNSTGVTGLSSSFFKDCDSLFAIAQRNGIYIDATMMSFDHCNSNEVAQYINWRNIINNQTASQTFIDKYLLPFLNRYKSNPYLFCIDLCNEPEWINQNTEDGQLSKTNLQRFFAMGAAAVHKNSSVPVTIGSACIKWNSDISGMDGNWWKNSALQAAYNDAQAYFDFYCIHYYGWMHQYFQSPYEKSPTDYAINDRPVIIEEAPGKDAGLTDVPITLVQAYEAALTKGYQGNFPWTSDGVDSNGDFSTIGPATNSFKNNHTSLVYPASCTTTSIEEKSGSETNVLLYPNPSKDILTIETVDEIQQVIFYNSVGEKMLSEKINRLSKIEINIEALPAGLYFVSLISDSTIETKIVSVAK